MDGCRWYGLTLGAALVVLGVGMPAAAQTSGAQTIEGDVSSVGTWEASGAAHSRVAPVDGRNAAAPALVPSSSVHFFDSHRAPAPTLGSGSSIHVTNAATAPAPRIAVDPCVKVSDDAQAAPLPVPADSKVQMINVSLDGDRLGVFAASRQA